MRSLSIQSIPHTQLTGLEAEVSGGVSASSAGQLQHQAMAQSRLVKAVVQQPPLRIRPSDDPVKWLKLLEGNKGTSIKVLLNQVLGVINACYGEGDVLNQLLDICENDPARLALVLRYGKSISERNRSRRESRLLGEVEQQLEQRHGAEINGGLNSAKAMAMYTNDGELLQSLRHTYYSAIIGKRSVNALFNAMVDLMGEGQFHIGMAVMQKALNEDLLSAFPSCKATVQLTALMSDAAIVNNLASLFGLCRDLLAKVNRFINPCQIDCIDLTRRVVNMTTSSFYLRELQRLSSDAVGNDILKQLVFLNYFYPLLKRLPDVLWVDSAQRNNTLLSVLRHMGQQTQTAGDFQYLGDKDKEQQQVKAKLVMQAGVPVIEAGSQS